MQQSAIVYNLTVDEFHTYFVGQAGTLVHNTNCRWENNVDILSRNASKLDPADKGGKLTKAGRALQKHGQRGSEHLPGVSGSPADINKQGQAVLDAIITSPGASFVTRETTKFGKVVEVRDPSGRGARFNVDGDFIGFLNP